MCNFGSPSSSLLSEIIFNSFVKTLLDVKIFGVRNFEPLTNAGVNKGEESEWYDVPN